MPETDQKKNTSLTIVGIGASAGGLNALKSFFSKVPQDSGLAFVVVIHLSPDHKSVMAELLQPHLNIPVLQVTKSVKIESNHVYVIPPNANLNTIDTHLRLSALEEKRINRAPIDHFFRTLSKTHDGSAVGVILTGTGSDGTIGLQEIKNKGGLIIVQDPYEAEYDGMPQSAISSGQVDMVLPVKQIPRQIMSFVATQPRLKSLKPGEEPDGEERHQLQRVFAQIKARTGRDFSRYKPSTIMRRLQRRMQIYQVVELEDYLEILRKDPEEVRSLADEFLINVTSFFRDQNVYEYLGEEVIPKLFDRLQPDQQLRVWSVGCATGEEAYTLAMLMMEEASSRREAPSLQIFASDLHDKSLQRAREGFYPGDVEADISEKRLRRFFTQRETGYQVRKELREIVIFTPHNLLSDPPFSKIDLIVCRNLLIYLRREVQRDVFDLFHYALNPDGHLLLGSSEHLESSELFRTENKELSLFAKRNVSGPEPRLPVFPQVKQVVKLPGEVPSQKSAESLGSMHQRMLEKYAPPSLLLSADHQVLHVSETAGRFLAIGGGELSRDVFTLVRPQLRMELRSIIFAAKESSEVVRSRPVIVKLNGKNHQVVMSARVQNNSDEENVTLVIFEESLIHSPRSDDEGENQEKNIDSAQIKELKSELSDTRQRLQVIVEEYETSREEMKASNEELQSANEELRSTMEELETSKEELQSMNEELTTLNQENRLKVEELGELNDDLQNLLSATDIATLFLDRELKILRFTPKLGELFNVRPVDRGRPISDQTHKLGYSELTEDAQNVLNKLVPVEREVSDDRGHCYFVRILPYRSSDDRIKGVVITFVDITNRKNVEMELRTSRENLKVALEAAQMGVWKLDLTSGKAETNLRHNQIFGFHEGVKAWDYATARERLLPEDRQKLDQAYEQARNMGVLDVEFRIMWPDGSIHWVHDRGHVIFDNDGKAISLTGVTTDVTEKKEVSEASRKSDERYRNILENVSEGFCLLERAGQKEKDFTIREVNQAFTQLTGLIEPGGKNISELPKPLSDRLRKLSLEASDTVKTAFMEELQSPAGKPLRMEIIPLSHPEQEFVALFLREINTDQ